MSDIHNPHDEFFKSLMQDKEMAICYFQYFLPSRIVEHLNFATLELDTNSYITEELKERYSDIVFSCQYKDFPIDLPLLLEHKSTVSEYPHIQLLRYMLEIWQQRLKEKQGLRPIVPIIFYHGEKRWHLRRFDEYFEGMDEDLLPFIPKFDYILNDLSQHSKLDLLRINFSFFINALLALKYKGNFLVLQQEVTFEMMDSAVMGTKLFYQLLVYVLGNTQSSGIVVKQFIEQLIESPKTGESMTMYDEFLQLADLELQKNFQQLKDSLEIEKQKTRQAERRAEEERQKREAQEMRMEKERQRREAQERKLEEERQKREAQERKLEEERQRREAQERKLEEEKWRAEEEHQRFLNSIRIMLKGGLSPDFVASALQLDIDFIQSFLSEVDEPTDNPFMSSPE